MADWIDIRFFPEQMVAFVHYTANQTVTILMHRNIQKKNEKTISPLKNRRY